MPQIFQLDKSFGAGGMVVKPGIALARQRGSAGHAGAAGLTVWMPARGLLPSLTAQAAPAPYDGASGAHVSRGPMVNLECTMRSFSLQTCAMAALLLAGSSLSVQAGSLGASSAAGGSSASVGSSASSGASSDSSSGKQKAATGPYRIIDMAELADRPGHVRLQLQALAADAPEPAHVLVLPQAVVAQHRLAMGQTITARPQAYGTEFVHGDSRQAFFLVLTEGWQRELESHPVLL